jgi:hypothetical protein
MSAQTLDKISGLVAMNSLMAMVGGTLVALVAGKNDPGFVHNGPLAGLVAVCAGSDLMHPLGALVTGAVAGGLFVVMFTLTQNRWKIDDVLGVWPLHGLCGAWGGIAAGIFGAKALGGLGGVAFMLPARSAPRWASRRRDRQPDRLRHAERSDRRPPPRCRRGIQRRRPDHPQDLGDARSARRSGKYRYLFLGQPSLGGSAAAPAWFSVQATLPLARMQEKRLVSLGNPRQ